MSGPFRYKMASHIEPDVENSEGKDGRYLTSTPTMPELAEETVPMKEYEALLKLLEDERILHAQTKAKLMEAEDKLEFALGDVEILQKQIAREKLQFEKTFGALKGKALKESFKNVELENKCQDIEQRVEERECNLNLRESEIQELTEKLEKQRKSYLLQMQDLEIKKQQDAYILRLMQGSNQTFSTKGPVEGVPVRLQRLPLCDIDKQQEEYVLNLLQSYSTVKSNVAKSHTKPDSCKQNLACNIKRNLRTGHIVMKDGKTSTILNMSSARKH